MASSSGTSSGSSVLQNSGSEEDLRQLMDERRRKRKISNRESARRSRLRKQKHVDDLMIQVSQYRDQNTHVLTNLKATTQRYLNVESENTVLRAQVAELSHRLQSLTEIGTFLNLNNNNNDDKPDSCGGSGCGLGLENPYNNGVSAYPAAEFLVNSSWNSCNYANQTILASAMDMLMY